MHPSIVSFHPDGTVIAGHAAKERQIVDAQNTIYSFKRLLGRDFNSDEMQRMLEYVRVGPRWARVERVEVLPEPPEGVRGFRVRS